MQLTAPLYFSGSSKNSSRTVTPEPDTRSSTPDSVRTDASTEQEIKTSSSTAKKLLNQGKISQDEYELLTGGLDRAHLEIRNKVNLARAWQTRSERLDGELDKVWDDLNETEEQLAAVQKAHDENEEQMGTIQQFYAQTLHNLNQYKLTNAQIIQEHVRLNRDNHKLSVALTQKTDDKKAEKQPPAKPEHADENKPAKREKTPPHKISLRQKLLKHNQELAEQVAKQAADQTD